MYTTLDWLIVCVLGGLGVGLYIGCVLHFRELCEVQEIYQAQVKKLAEQEYNGWVNRETWAFMLWQSGDAFLYDLMREMSAQIAVDQLIFQDPYETTKGHFSNRGMTEIEHRNLGAEYIDQWSAYAEEMVESDYNEHFSAALNDIGSMWRVDPQEIGEALEESVREDIFNGFNIATVEVVGEDD